MQDGSVIVKSVSLQTDCRFLPDMRSPLRIPVAGHYNRTRHHYYKIDTSVNHLSFHGSWNILSAQKVKQESLAKFLVPIANNILNR